MKIEEQSALRSKNLYIALNLLLFHALRSPQIAYRGVLVGCQGFEPQSPPSRMQFAALVKGDALTN
jgi:hypothetical protein